MFWLGRIVRLATSPSWLVQRIAAQDKKYPEIPLDQEDMDLLIEIHEAYAKHQREKALEEQRKQRESQPPKVKDEIHFASRRRADAEVEDEAKTTGPPPRWEEFLDAKYDGGKKRVKNTSPKTKGTYPEVRVTTLMKTDKAFMKKIMEEYRRWLKDSPEPDTKSRAKPEFGAKFPEQWDLEDVGLKKDALAALKELGLEPKDALDVAGLGAVDDPSVYMEIVARNGKIVVKALGNKGPQLDDLMVSLDFKNKKMKLDFIELSPKAPKGVGTKMMAAQLDKARELGLKSVELDAHRDDDRGLVGYKVWPRLGYDGPIPVEKTGMPKEFQDALTNAGHKQPWRIQQLFGLGKKAIDWWDKEGDSFDAVFDLADDSASMKLFGAYVKKKGGYDQLVAS